MRRKCIAERLNDNVCPIDKKFSELKVLEKYELLTEWIRKKWLNWIFRIIIFSLIFLFGIGIYAENMGSKFDILKNLNTWVGFILGGIATIFSIISMFLSFYSLEKSKESEDSTKKTLIEIKDTVYKLENILKTEFENLKNKNEEILLKVDRPEKYKETPRIYNDEFTRY